MFITINNTQKKNKSRRNISTNQNTSISLKRQQSNSLVLRPLSLRLGWSQTSPEEIMAWERGSQDSSRSSSSGIKKRFSSIMLQKKQSISASIKLALASRLISKVFGIQNLYCNRTIIYRTCKNS